MSRVLYVHRISKMLEELVRDLGMTVVLSDRTTQINLGVYADTLVGIANDLGIKASKRTDDGKTTIEFAPK
jgi:hypothetical protein